MTFRLHTAKEGHVNFEFLNTTNYSIFYKPIAFFSRDSNYLSITILKEFENGYLSIKKSIKNSINVKFLPLKENAFIAVALKEILPILKNLFKESIPSSKSLLLNGLVIHIRKFGIFFLESVLDENYEELIDDTLIFVYKNYSDGSISIHSGEPEFDWLNERWLLTLFSITK